MVRPAVRRRIGALKRDPPDEARDAEIEEISRERQGLQGILRGLNGRNTYEFLTDEGLIPNYAFPDASRIATAFREYMEREGAAVTRAMFERNLAGKVGDVQFNADMSALLRPGFEWRPEEAARTVSERLMPRRSTGSRSSARTSTYWRLPAAATWRAIIDLAAPGPPQSMAGWRASTRRARVAATSLGRSV